MLTLGSIQRDAAAVGEVERAVRLRGRVERDAGALVRILRSRLRQALHFAVAQTPWFRYPAYARVVEADDPVAALAAAPLLEKFQLRQMLAEFISDKDASGYFGIETSGSTGVPLQAWFDRAYYIANLANFKYFLRTKRIRFRPLATGLMHVSAFREGEVCSFVMPALSYSIYHHVRLHLSRWKSKGEAARWVVTQAPVILGGLPSALDLLAGFAEAESPAGLIRLRAVLSYAEILSPEVRRRLERVFRAPVFDQYGLTELGGPLATECYLHDGFHIAASDYLVEAVDPDGAPVPDGTEGELVVTNLYSRTVPLIRYKTGDRGVLTREHCRCGRITPRIAVIRGREITRFQRPDGIAYNPYDEYRKLLAVLPMRQFQMVQENGHEITLRYVSDVAIEGLLGTANLMAAVRAVQGAELALQRVDRFDVSNGKFQSFLRVS